MLTQRLRPLATLAAVALLLTAAPASGAGSASTPSSPPATPTTSQGVADAAADAAAHGLDRRLPGLPDLDAATIPQLQQQMRSGRLTSTRLTLAYLARIHRYRRRPRRGAGGQPRSRCTRRRSSDLHRAPPRRRGRAGGRARAAQGQRRHPGAGRHRRVARAAAVAGPTTRTSCSSCTTPARSSSARRTCRSGRTSAPTNSSSGWSAVGGLTEQRLRARPQPVRLVVGLGRRRRGVPRAGRRRHRDRRLDRLPVRRQRRRRAQADPRAGQPRRHRADLGRAGHRRTDGPPRGRRRASPSPCSRARRSATRRRRRSRPARPATTPRALDADALEGARIGVWLRWHDRLARDRRDHRAGRGRPRGRRRAPPSTSSCPTWTSSTPTSSRRCCPSSSATSRRTWPRRRAATRDTLAELIAFNEADPVELEFFGQEIFELALAAPAADSAETQQAARGRDDRGAGAASTRRSPRTTSTRSWRRPTARPGSPPWAGRRVRVRLVGPGGRRGLPERHGARRLQRRAARRAELLRRPAGTTPGCISPRLRVRAGHRRPPAAAAAAHDRRLTARASDPVPSGRGVRCRRAATTRRPARPPGPPSPS